MLDWAKYVFAPVPVASWVAAGLLSTVTGPLGTFESMAPALRASYWFTVLGLALVIGMSVRRLVERQLDQASFWPRAVATALVFALLFTPVLLLINGWLAGPESPPPFTASATFLMAFAVPMALTPVMSVFEARASQQRSPVSEPSQPRILQRLSGAVSGDLLRLSVEDHYVNVFVEGGKERLLMRLRDAVAEADGVDGLQVHRSHWVATEAVTGHERSQGRVFLKLKDGSTVPVSRNYRDAVARVGLI